MSITVAVRHKTKYTYDQDIQVFPQVIRLRPAPHTRSPVKAYSLNISPKEHFINWQQDPFGNYLARVTVLNKTDHFEIDVELIFEMVTINPFDFFLEEYAEYLPFTYVDNLKKELSPYLEIMEDGPLLRGLLEEAKKFHGKRSVDFLVAVNQLVERKLNYNIRMEPGVQSCEETLEKRRGSCRDFAWLVVQLFRHLGLASRFVSGYLVQLKADQKPVEGPTGTNEDFTDLHAWAEVYLPGAGWIGLDATSGLFAGEGHIPLACAPHPASAAPISGSTEITQVTFDFENLVERIYEKPRVTKPYSESEWKAIYELGLKIDQELDSYDVRLTMGGEPTFVSMLDMESPQWNDAADGDDKKQMAFNLAGKLLNEFGPSGFIHHGQGKWYPGEPLPRWQYALYWRKDGQRIWSQNNLLGDPSKNYGFSYEHAKTFIHKVANYLGVPTYCAMPAYEDVFYYLWESSNLPINIDPLSIDPKDKAERQRLSSLLDQGITNPIGFVLPLEIGTSGQWLSQNWPLQRDQLFLIPGDSSIGLRLPLDRLPYMVEKQQVIEVAASPLDTLAALESPDSVYHKQNVRKGQENAMSEDAQIPELDKDIYVPQYPMQTIKTALCVEAREGKLYAFMPPFKSLESYLHMIYAIERVAAELKFPILIEGYNPPTDNRLEKLVVAPDPGVVEVNVQPEKDWASIVNNYNALFNHARDSRLGTEKFMLDGKHSGTGGGNHITLGGKTPADSPFLRRPDLLRSFINFWQNHPGLSYLFSSTFIGPTSQAPRIDEARIDMLYEMEIAFAELDRHPNPPPWLVDRIFRNLLVDLTGNTHRAEFCIDKMYSPDSMSGRLGILEMRGFDMPPHKEMCLAQILLVRALTAAFWKQPYRQKLIRWGSQLHDRFLTHHFVKEDLKEVLHYLNNAGFDYPIKWLEPFFEFRFPILGRVQRDHINITLRAAIEPWHVLGEEMSNTGTARFVDSSVERVEIKVEGIQNERYKLLCNHTAIPLTSTGTHGHYVAAVRYKAWNPPSALHPTIGVDTPLVFDIYDSWNRRSIGGCTYYVSHPGGRSYDTFPVNSFEAEARRINRFWENRHSPSPVEQKTQENGMQTNRYVTETYSTIEDLPVQSVEVDPEFPMTLDLRKVDKV